MEAEYILPKLKKLCALWYSDIKGKPFAWGKNRLGYTFGIMSNQGRIKIENKVTKEVAMYLIIDKVPKK